MNTVHKRIIDAILEKEKQECPGTLDLLGIYGSVSTGDVHEHSDLDLLVLINDLMLPTLRRMLGYLIRLWNTIFRNT